MTEPKLTKLDQFTAKALLEGFRDENADTIIQNMGAAQKKCTNGFAQAGLFMGMGGRMENERFLAGLFVEMEKTGKPYQVCNEEIKEGQVDERLKKLIRILPTGDGKTTLLVPKDELFKTLAQKGWGDTEMVKRTLEGWDRSAREEANQFAARTKAEPTGIVGGLVKRVRQIIPGMS